MKTFGPKNWERVDGEPKKPKKMGGGGMGRWVTKKIGVV